MLCGSVPGSRHRSRASLKAGPVGTPSFTVRDESMPFVYSLGEPLTSQPQAPDPPAQVAQIEAKPEYGGAKLRRGLPMTLAPKGSPTLPTQRVAVL